MIDSYVKTKNGRERITAYTVDECKPPVLAFKEIQRNHIVKKYASDFICFDTETSHADLECAWVYQWAIKLKSMYVYGRTVSEFIALLNKLAEHYHLSDKKKILIYVHNLSYDYCYVKHSLREYDPKIDILAIDNHSILQIDVLGFRFICSYKLTNLSLAKLSESYAKTYDKAVGEIDYNKVRFQDSKLSIESDWYYMFSDVASQEDGIKNYIRVMGYDCAYKCPITSTGFVRKNCLEASRAAGWRDEFLKMALTLDEYKLHRLAFMGGVTIAAFPFTGKTLRGDNLGHKDFTSSYPARQTLDYAPTGKPMLYGEVDSMEELNELLTTQCCIFVFEVRDINIKKGVTAPYIPFSKCLECKDVLKVNGKVVYASLLRMVVTELDFDIIRRLYTWRDNSLRVGNMYIYERGEFPQWLKDEVMQYFINKSTLKEKDPELYQKSKNMLNAIYGMSATTPLRDNFKFTIDEDEGITATDMIMGKVKRTEEEEEKALQKFYNSRNSFMPYVLGIYTTAHARHALYDLIAATGDSDGDGDDLTEVFKNFLYCDTDSVFYIKTPQNEKRMAAYVEECKQRAIAAGAFVGNNYLGLPTDEAPICAFRALHAKCYAMEEYNKKTGQYELQVTIAGIPKKATKFINGKAVTITNAEELGNIDNLNDGFIFEHCGGSRAIYNEMPKEQITIRGHKLEIESSVIIDNIEKEVNDTMWSVEGYELYNLVYSEI